MTRCQLFICVKQPCSWSEKWRILTFGSGVKFHNPFSSLIIAKTLMFTNFRTLKLFVAISVKCATLKVWIFFTIFPKFSRISPKISVNCKEIREKCYKILKNMCENYGKNVMKFWGNFAENLKRFWEKFEEILKHLLGNYFLKIFW